MPPMISIVGKSGSGKTTLLEKLVAELKKREYKIGTIKHASEGFDIDKKGKDSWRHQQAGADTVVVASSGKIAMVKNESHDTLDDLEKYFSDMHLVITEGFKKELELVGIGYRAEKKGGGLSLSLGFSHPVEFKPPEGVNLEVADKTKITVSGIDKQLVGQTAARIRSLRPPEPYKGKGIKYADEVIKKKPGKAGKVGVGAFGPPAK